MAIHVYKNWIPAVKFPRPAGHSVKQSIPDSETVSILQSSYNHWVHQVHQTSPSDQTHQNVQHNLFNKSSPRYKLQAVFQQNQCQQMLIKPFRKGSKPHMSTSSRPLCDLSVSLKKVKYVDLYGTLLWSASNVLPLPISRHRSPQTKSTARHSENTARPWIQVGVSCSMPV